MLRKICIVNMLSYDYENVVNEVNNSPSLTIPDQTMSIKEILERYARGLPMDVGKVPIYDEEHDDVSLLDTRNLDLVEIQELKEKFVEEIQTIKKNEKERKTKKSKTVDVGSSEELPTA